MKTILVLNIGSSSIKYDVYVHEKKVLGGYLERVTDFEKGIKSVISELDKKKLKVDAIGHRVVHGGTHSESKLLDDKMVNELDKISELAPLHNVPEVKGIRVCKKLFGVPMVAVFDTAFHATIPDRAATYAIPLQLAKKHMIKRYGFHGTSHKYVAHETAKRLGKHLDDLKLITCHIGNGASVCAINHGVSVDTSMGFTPLEGLVMGTRCGDMDPAIVEYLQKKEKLGPAEVDTLLNKKSGLLGLCGTNDMRDVHKRKSKDDKAHLAFEVYCYRLIKYIGAYTAAMNGVDAIVWTAGVGEHAYYVRERVMSHFGYLGVKMDLTKNKKNATVVSAAGSKVKVMVVPTNEQLMMVREVRKVLKG
ncbi:TPA: acetate kinase [Candidatus Woesearchaeota archaeon]|nr:acetate kinase [Candidatus Woesearchaeota archaeon]